MSYENGGNFVVELPHFATSTVVAMCLNGLKSLQVLNQRIQHCNFLFDIYLCILNILQTKIEIKKMNFNGEIIINASQNLTPFSVRKQS